MKKVWLNDSDLHTDYFVNLLGDNYTLLLGSGVSIWEPSNLPSGQKITKHILDSIVAKYSNLNDKQYSIVKDWFMELPFEVVLQRCLESDKILDWVYSIFSKGKPNELHKALTYLASMSTTKFIITTNYDTCIEQSLDSNEIKWNTIVKRLDAINKLEKDKEVLQVFKIHGSAELDKKDSLIYTVAQEAKLPKWKKHLLKKKVKDSNLLIVGYSGLDFEVCPEILELKPKRIIWNFLDEENLNKSPGFQNFILNNATPIDVVAVLGDMRILLLKVLKEKFDCVNVQITDKEPPDFEKMREQFKRLWASRILQALGVGGPSASIFRSIDPNDIDNLYKYQFYKYYGRALYFKGGNSLKYAISKFEEAIKVAPYHKKIDCHISIVNCLIGSRDYRNANIWLNKTRKFLRYSNNNFTAQYLLSRAYLAKIYYEKLDLNINSVRASKIRSCAKVILEKAAILYLKTGDYSDFNTCWLLAKQMDVALELNTKENMKPSMSGFKHLGYKLPEFIDFRISIEKKDILNSVEINKLKKYYYQAITLGIGECHKLEKLMRKHALLMQ